MRLDDVSPERYPIHIEAFCVGNRMLVWEVVLERPPVELRRLLSVPALAHRYGPVAVRVIYGDGTVDEIDPEDA